MPTRCNRGFYCRSYCLFNMFRAPLCPSSGAQEYYRVPVVSIVRSRTKATEFNFSFSCCLWYFVLWFSSSWSGVELRVMRPVSRMLQHPENRTHNPQFHTRTATWKKHSTKYHRQQPLYYTLELLMTCIVVPETCWACNKICKKNPSVTSSWHFISAYWRRCCSILHAGHITLSSTTRSATWKPQHQVPQGTNTV